MTHRRGRSSGAVHQLTGERRGTSSADGLPPIQPLIPGPPQQNRQSPLEGSAESVSRINVRRFSDAFPATPSPLHLDLQEGPRPQRKFAAVFPPGIQPPQAIVAPSAVVGRAHVGVCGISAVNGVSHGLTSMPTVATPPLSPIYREGMISISSFSPVTPGRQLSVPQIPSPCPSPVHMESRRYLDLTGIARPRPRAKSAGRGRGLVLSPCPSPTPFSRVADSFVEHHGSDPTLYNASSPVLSPPQIGSWGGDGPSPLGGHLPSQSSSSASSPTSSRLNQQTSILDEPIEIHDPKEPLQPSTAWGKNQPWKVTDLEREFGALSS